MRTAFLERLINRSWTRLPRCKTCERRASSDGRVASMAYATELRTQCTVPGIGALTPVSGRPSPSGWRLPHIFGGLRAKPWDREAASWCWGSVGGVHVQRSRSSSLNLGVPESTFQGLSMSMRRLGNRVSPETPQRASDTGALELEARGCLRGRNSAVAHALGCDKRGEVAYKHPDLQTHASRTVRAAQNTAIGRWIVSLKCCRGPEARWQT